MVGQGTEISTLPVTWGPPNGLINLSDRCGASGAAGPTATIPARSATRPTVRVAGDGRGASWCRRKDGFMGETDAAR
jgi:hypothetical protein